MKTDPFHYIAPTDATIPRYDAVRAAERACRQAITDTEYAERTNAFNAINAACRDFAAVIEAQAPNCADRTTAIRCVRLARMEANEGVATGQERTCQAWHDALRQARMWACAAIALADESELPTV